MNFSRPLAALTLVSLLFLLSCSQTKTEESTSETVAAEDSLFNAETDLRGEEEPTVDIKLKGIYATSTKTPASKFGYQNLFDNDNKTYWATMPGAAPDEGIMMYFEKPLTISFVEIYQPELESMSPILSVSVYTNGQKFKDAELVGPRFDLGATEVSSLFIKINEVVDISTYDREGVMVKSFPTGYSAAISGISLYVGDAVAQIIAPQVVKGTMEASSTLEPAVSYGIRNLFDSRKEFAWVEGAPGSGENQSLTFRFNSEQEISGLRLMNGFQRSEKHFGANARIKKLIATNEKGESAEVNIGNAQGEQTLALTPSLKGKEIKLSVKEVYPGTSYKDLVLSELKFTNASGDFILEDNVTESIKNDLLEKVKGSVLESILDNRVSNEFQEMDGYVRSIILRSDYTFVAYFEDWTERSAGSDTNEIIADGNWEIKELGPTSAKVRIFGKLVRLSESSDYYKGDTSSAYLQIFQDNLIIDPLNIRGEKFIEPLVMAPKEN